MLRYAVPGRFQVPVCYSNNTHLWFTTAALLRLTAAEPRDLLCWCCSVLLLLLLFCIADLLLQ